MDLNNRGPRIVASAELPVAHSDQIACLTIPKDGSFTDYSTHVHHCRDDRARLRWRIAKHPEHQRTWVLRPCSGRLLIRMGAVYYGYSVP